MDAQRLDEMLKFSGLLDEALDFAKVKAKLYAEKEREYRKAKAEAWANDPGEGLAAARDARIQAATADLRYERDLADQMRQLGIEAIRSRRAQLSAWQTYLNAEKAEAEFARTGPR